MSTITFAPTVAGPEAGEETRAEAAVAGLVAAFLGIGLAVVIFICSVCSAKSFGACLHAVQVWWTTGCK
jgi:hypothetical protein